MPLDIVIDAFWGSGGKGKVSAAYADRIGHRHLSTSNHPNAGHTFRDDERTIVFKNLHSAAALGNRFCYLSADSVIDIGQLMNEITVSQPLHTFIHERAMWLHPDDLKEEQQSAKTRIAST